MGFRERDLVWFRAEASIHDLDLTEEDLNFLCEEVNRVKRELAALVHQLVDNTEPPWRFLPTLQPTTMDPGFSQHVSEQEPRDSD
jgi:hypothetical protein